VYNITRNSEDKECADVTITLGKEFEAYDPNTPGSKRFHEAGYDAYCTGHAFAKMYYTLDNEEKEKVKNSINTMGSFYHFKNGHISYDEPWWHKV
jgi:hypothetical protein